NLSAFSSGVDNGDQGHASHIHVAQTSATVTSANPANILLQDRGLHQYQPISQSREQSTSGSLKMQMSCNSLKVSSNRYSGSGGSWILGTPLDKQTLPCRRNYFEGEGTAEISVDTSQLSGNVKFSNEEETDEETAGAATSPKIHHQHKHQQYQVQPNQHHQQVTEQLIAEAKKALFLQAKLCDHTCMFKNI
ncbi:unnamed protein product, partial [Protopolystoma xenopodis]